MAAKKRTRRLKMSEEAASAAKDIAGQMRDLRAKDGYVVFNNIGPYDHNPHDMALPHARYPKVFKALYEAVDYAESQLRYYDKIKIQRLTPSPSDVEWPPFYSEVVWRSWGTWESEDRRRQIARRKQLATARKGRALEHVRRDRAPKPSATHRKLLDEWASLDRQLSATRDRRERARIAAKKRHVGQQILNFERSRDRRASRSALGGRR